MRRSVLAFVVGVAYVQTLAQLPPIEVAWWSLPLAVVALRWRHAIPLVFLPLGIAWGSAYGAHRLHDRLAPELEGRDTEIVGVVADLPQRAAQGWRFVLDVEQAATGVPPHILLSTYDRSVVPHAGTRWRYTVRLKRPHGWQNPGGFDYEAYLLHAGIGATGYVRADPAPTPLPISRYAYPVLRLRADIGARIGAALSDRPFAGTIAAFVNGDQHAVTAEQWQVLQLTGTAHLLAISGMNIGWVAGLMFFCARWLWSRSMRLCLYLAAPRFAAIAAIAAALIYAALAGFSIPTQRALIMIAVAMLATVLQRRTQPSRVLALALLLVVLYDPLSVMSVGFWLSFVSVAVILVLMTTQPRPSALQQWSRLQWGVTLALVPLLVVWFHRVPLASPIANAIAIPAIEIAIIPLSLVGALSLYVLPPSLAVVPLTAAEKLLQWLWQPLHWFATQPALQWSSATPSLWALIAAAVGIVWMLLPRGWPMKWLGVAWCLPAMFTPIANPAPGAVWFSLLDVGQGLAAVVRTAHHTLVFDTGPYYSTTFNGGTAALLPYLRAGGVGQVDVLVLSHDHQDHIGGAGALIESYPPQRILSSVPMSAAERCRRGAQWTWDGVRFTVLNPDTESAGDDTHHDNNRSCVLRVDADYGRILLPGDIERDAEIRLVARYGAALQADVLVAPHHGSKTSSSPAFIDAVHPRWVLYPVGYRNRYRHPHPTVDARYAERVIKRISTADSGALMLKLDAGGMRLERYRATHAHYWSASTSAMPSGSADTIAFETTP